MTPVRTFRDTPARTLDAPPRRVAPPHPHAGVLAVQRLAGNRATRRLLRDDLSVPKDLTAADARPLPTVAAPATATFKQNPAIPGTWDDAGLTSGTVGSMKRILLDGLPGNQREQGPEDLDPKPDPKTLAHAVGKGKKDRGRAVAIVPPSLTKDSGKVAVIVHFHGIDIQFGSGKILLGSSGMRQITDPEDVKDFQIPQQVEAFLKARQGARVVVLMPIGVTVRAGKGYTVDFGIPNLEAYIKTCLSRLDLDPTPDGIYLSAHSGGGFTISGMADQLMIPGKGKAPALAQDVRGVFGFEAFHGDTSTFSELAVNRLEADVRELQAIEDKGGDEAAKTADQLTFLRDKGFRFSAFGGGDYIKNVDAIRKAIVKWFDTDGHAALKKAMGGKIRTDVLRQLWLNFQALDYAGSTHMNALSLDSHFGQALANLPNVGALAGKPAPQKAPPVGAHQRDP